MSTLHQIKRDDAFRAVEALFADESVGADETLAALARLQEDIKTYIAALREEIAPRAPDATSAA